MSPVHHLPIPHEGGRLSNKYTTAPNSWSQGLQRDLRTIGEWLMVHREGDPALVKRWISRVSGIEAGFLGGSRVMGVVMGVRCECESLPHSSSCMIWKRIEIQEHMYSTWGITAKTKHPPDGYLEGILKFPLAG